MEQTVTFLHPQKAYQIHEKARASCHYSVVPLPVHLLLYSSAHSGKCLKEKP